MTVERIKELYEAKPFRPFFLHLADGREIPVQHPEFMLVAPSGRTVVVIQPDDRLNIVDLLLVTDVEIKPSANGSGRRRKG